MQCFTFPARPALLILDHLSPIGIHFKHGPYHLSQWFLLAWCHPYVGSAVPQGFGSLEIICSVLRGKESLAADTPPAVCEKEMTFGAMTWVRGAKLKGRIEKGETVPVPGWSSQGQTLHCKQPRKVSSRKQHFRSKREKSSSTGFETSREGKGHVAPLRSETGGEKRMTDPLRP